MNKGFKFIKHGLWLWAMMMAAFTVQVQAQTSVAEDPYKMIQRVADQTFKRIVQDKALIEADPNHLKSVVREELMPYINAKLTAKLVLGKKLNRSTSPQDKEAFFKAFHEYLITTYATVFTKYNDQKVVFEPARSTKGKKVVTVKTRIVDGNRPDIHIDFKVRLNKKTGKWLAYDMIAEGISLLNAKKSELKGLLRQKDGVAKVAQMLNEKASAVIKKDSADS